MRRRWLSLLQKVFLALVALSLLLMWWLEASIKPVVLSLGEARVRAAATGAINTAISEMTNDTSYEDLVDVRLDSAGRVSMMLMNTVSMNRLSARTAIAAQRNISDIGAQGLSIPLFTALGSQLLAGRGPTLYLRVVPVGSVTTDFRTEFSSAGINQTRHRVFLCLAAQVRIIIPTGSRQVEIATQVPIAETVIVGEVPNTFLQGTGALDLVPNDGR